MQPTSPHFEPHVTLYHPIALDHELDMLISKLSDICLQMPNELRLNINTAETGTSYYQSVLAAVQRHGALALLRRLCEQTFGPLDKPFFAHLSLKYGDMDQHLRSSIAAQSDIPCPLVIEGITIMRLVGPVGSWERMRFIRFAI
jgi:hypothetical protein